MNAPVNTAESTALALQQQQAYEISQVTDAASLILGGSFDRVRVFSEMMARGSVSVPKHLRGNIGDCMAITIQALGWKMNPFAVAQKTHLSQSGALGYEAQLISAILVSTGAIKEEPEFEAVGDWDKVLGKVEERQGKAREDGSPGGKYYVATYTKKDEEGLGVIVRATLTGASKPRELKVMMSQAYPRFSTQWANDPFQQLCYLAVRKWARLNSPGPVLGVYTPDELEQTGERFMGPADVVGAPPPPPAPPASYSQADFEKNLPTWTEVIATGRKTPDGLITWAEGRGAKFTDEQKATLRALKGPTDATPKTGTPKGEEGPRFSYAELAEQINKATGPETLDPIRDLARHLPEDQQAELADAVQRRSREIGLTS